MFIRPFYLYLQIFLTQQAPLRAPQINPYISFPPLTHQIPGIYADHGEEECHKPADAAPEDEIRPQEPVRREVGKASHSAEHLCHTAYGELHQAPYPLNQREDQAHDRLNDRYVDQTIHVPCETQQVIKGSLRAERHQAKHRNGRERHQHLYHERFWISAFCENSTGHRAKNQEYNTSYNRREDL